MYYCDAFTVVVLLLKINAPRKIISLLKFGIVKITNYHTSTIFSSSNEQVQVAPLDVNGRQADPKTRWSTDPVMSSILAMIIIP
jgi:hypothetical protein